MTKKSMSTTVLGMGLCAAFTLFAAGCDDDDETRQFRVRIENVSGPLATSGGPIATPLSPGAFAVFNGDNPLYETEKIASLGLERLAEDGNPSLLATEAIGLDDVEETGVFGQAPLLPGEVIEFTINARPGDRFAFATQYAVSNDLFFAPDKNGIPLFTIDSFPIDDVELDIELWDAGTEVNEEPGVGASTKPEQPNDDFGITENGVILQIQDVNDPFAYPDPDQVLRVEIELID